MITNSAQNKKKMKKYRIGADQKQTSKEIEEGSGALEDKASNADPLCALGNVLIQFKEMKSCTKVSELILNIFFD